MSVGPQPMPDQPTPGQPGDYGLQDAHPVDYQTQRQAEDIADHTLAQNGQQLFGPRGALAKIRAQNKAVAAFTSTLPAEVHALGEGLSMRQAPPFQAPHHEAFSHAELRDMVTRGVHTGTVGEAGDTWLAMGNDLACFHDEFKRALDSSATAWTEANTDAARAAVAELANAGARTGQAAQLAGMATHQVSRALSLANHHMPAPHPRSNTRRPTTPGGTGYSPAPTRSRWAPRPPPTTPPLRMPATLTATPHTSCANTTKP